VLPGNEDIDYYPKDDYIIDNKDGDPENGDANNGEPEANTINDYDKLIGATFLLDPMRAPGNVATKATVLKRKTDLHGKPLGRGHSNPLLDTREYVVELEDGMFDSYFANTIAENLYTQCDAEGREFNTIQEIIDHKTDGQALFYYVNGQQRNKKTTAGWKLQVEFTNGSTDWIPLKDVKHSNPIQLAEYAIMNKIDDEPAFKWWVPWSCVNENE
jgi:hypothetical protein